MSLLSRRFLARRPRPQVVIVGANFAGLSAARALDAGKFQVTVVDAAPAAQWLPNVHELLSRRKTPEQLLQDRRTILAVQGHDFLCASARSIDRSQQRLCLDDGSWLDYDALILATGSMANDRGIPGVATHALFPRSVATATHIGHALTRLAALPAGRDVVLVGGGIEGLEMLGEILRRHGQDQRFTLHLVEMSAKLFPRFPGLHERLLDVMQGQVRLHLGRSVKSVHADCVELDNGESLESRLTLWCGGRRGSAFTASAGLSQPGADVPVYDTLQSQADDRLFVAGDAALLPQPLEKQAYYAQDMGRHAALNVQRLLQGKPLQAFRPLHKPSLLSFGDRDGIMLYGNQALASPALVALKEAIYQYGFHQWSPPRSGRDVFRLARDLRHGIQELNTWRLLAKSSDTRMFQAR